MTEEKWIYALYKGDDLITMGKIQKIAKELGIKESTVHHYMTPTYKKRTSEKYGRRLVRLS